mmetsp:Transcript_14977/g.46507  ORF Transcript_14977/g.46507 Transcript_14977/m.46507 type:complete len:350 (-) Transcript_14977:22-1071(-)
MQHGVQMSQPAHADLRRHVRGSGGPGAGARRGHGSRPPRARRGAARLLGRDEGLPRKFRPDALARAPPLRPVARGPRRRARRAVLEVENRRRTSGARGHGGDDVLRARRRESRFRRRRGRARGAEFVPRRARRPREARRGDRRRAARAHEQPRVRRFKRGGQGPGRRDFISGASLRGRLRGPTGGRCAERWRSFARLRRRRRPRGVLGLRRALGLDDAGETRARRAAPGTRARFRRRRRRRRGGARLSRRPRPLRRLGHGPAPPQYLGSHGVGRMPRPSREPRDGRRRFRPRRRARRPRYRARAPPPDRFGGSHLELLLRPGCVVVDVDAGRGDARQSTQARGGESVRT